MKHIFIIILIYLLTLTHAFSQKSKWGVDLSEIRKNKNHLELDIKSVFNGFTNASLLYKHTYKSGKLIKVNSINLWRVFGTIDNQFVFTNPPDTIEYKSEYGQYTFHPSRILDFSLGFGLEKQYMKKFMTHYLGIDGIFSIFKNDDDISNLTIGSVINNYVETTDRKIQAWNAGVNPFLGFKFYFSRNFSLGIETGISLSYFQQKVLEIEQKREYIDNKEVIIFKEKGTYKSNGIKTKFNNLRFLNVGYTF